MKFVLVALCCGAVSLALGPGSGLAQEEKSGAMTYGAEFDGDLKAAVASSSWVSSGKSSLLNFGVTVGVEY